MALSSQERIDKILSENTAPIHSDLTPNEQSQVTQFLKDADKVKQNYGVQDEKEGKEKSFAIWLNIFHMGSENQITEEMIERYLSLPKPEEKEEKIKIGDKIWSEYHGELREVLSESVTAQGSVWNVYSHDSGSSVGRSVVSILKKEATKSQPLIKDQGEGKEDSESTARNKANSEHINTMRGKNQYWDSFEDGWRKALEWYKSLPPQAGGDYKKLFLQSEERATRLEAKLVEINLKQNPK